MTSIQITPNLREEGSLLLKKFLNSKFKDVKLPKMKEQKDYRTANSFPTTIDNNITRYTYFNPRTIINFKDSEVAKKIHIIA